MPEEIEVIKKQVVYKVFDKVQNITIIFRYIQDIDKYTTPIYPSAKSPLL